MQLLAQQPFPFFPGFHVQGWPPMPAFVPQGYPPQQPPQGQQPPVWGQAPRPGFPQPMPRPLPPRQPDLTPDVDEPDTRNHPNPGPSGPEHESEADVFPAKPDDGAGGGPTSATPGRPLVAVPGYGYGRLSGALHQVTAVAVSSSQDGQSVPVVSYVTNVIPRVIPGAIPASPLVPAGHSIVYYDEVSHGGAVPKESPDQKPDESQQKQEQVQFPDETQQSAQAPEQPAVVLPVPSTTAAPPAVEVIPDESPVPAPAILPAAESSGEEQPAAETDEDGQGNDQPAVGVSNEESASGEEQPASDEPEKRPPPPQELRKTLRSKPAQELPNGEEQEQAEDVPQVPQVPQVVQIPQQEVKGGKRRPQYQAKGGVKGVQQEQEVKGQRPVQVPEQSVKGQAPIPAPLPLAPSPHKPFRKSWPRPAQIPEQSIKGQAPVPETVVVQQPHLPAKGGRRRVQQEVPAIDVAIDEPVPVVVPQQAVKGGVKGQRPIRVPEQSVKGQAPVQVPADESEALAPPAPVAKGGRRRIQIQPQTPIAEEEVIPQVPQQAVKGGVKGGYQQQETKGRQPPPPSTKRQPLATGSVKGQQQEEVVPEQQEQAVKG